jgi:hypothetical protein
MVVKKIESKLLALIVMIMAIISLSKNIPKYISLLLVLILFFIFIYEFIKDKKRENPITPMYLYVSGFMSITIIIIFVILRTLSLINKNVQLIILGCSIIPISYFFVMRLKLMLKSKNEEQIAMARLSMFMILIFIIIVSAIIIGVISLGDNL